MRLAMLVVVAFGCGEADIQGNGSVPADAGQPDVSTDAAPVRDGSSPDTSAPPSGLPDKIVGEWWWCFDPPTIATVQAQAPQVNYLSLVGAFVDGNGSGNVTTGFAIAGYSDAQLIADIGAWKASGRVVVGMIGGGGDTTVIANATHATEFVNAALPIIDKYGLQGVDFDLENTPDAASVASIIGQLKGHYGREFIIAMSPRPYELRSGGVYRAVIQAAGIDNIDLIQPKTYALNGNSLDAQRSYMDGDLAEWTANMFSPSKLLIGSFDPAEGESTATAVQTYSYYKSIYPTLRGSVFWETREDANQLNWQWSVQIAQAN